MIININLFITQLIFSDKIYSRGSFHLNLNLNLHLHISSDIIAREHKNWKIID